MQKEIVLLLGSLLLLTSFASADRIDLEITSPDGNKEFMTSGTLVVPVTVQNPADSTENANSIRIVGSADGLTFSSLPTTTTIEPGDSAEFSLTITGFVWQRTKVKITASGASTDTTVREDSVSIYLIPPKLDVKITAPVQEINLVDFQEGGSKTFEVQVVNLGDYALEEVALTVEPESGLTCSGSAPMSLGVGAKTTYTYTVTCNNITSGKTVELTVRDKYRAVYDTESITFKIVEEEKTASLIITSPADGTSLQIDEGGGSIGVMAANVGERDLFEVCAFIDELNATGNECVDLAVSESKTIMVSVAPMTNVTDASIRITDAQGLANDEISIRLLKKQREPPVIEEEEEPPIVAENNTPPPEEKPSEGTSWGNDIITALSNPYVIVFVIVTPLGLLAAFVLISLSKGKRENAPQK